MKWVVLLPLWEGVGGGDKHWVVCSTRLVGENQEEGLGGLGLAVVDVDSGAAQTIPLRDLEWSICMES